MEATAAWSVRQTSEMTKFGALDDNEVVCIDRVECPRAVQYYEPNDRRTIYSRQPAGQSRGRHRPGSRAACLQ